jgi:phosphate:Na+ symporter
LKRFAVILFILILVFTESHAEKQTISLIKPDSKTIPNYCGDEQHYSVSEKSDSPIRVQVLRNNHTPVAGHPVFFSFGKIPDGTKNAKIYHPIAYTDSLGIAKTNIFLGSKDGEYEIIAKINQPSQTNVQTFNLYARKSNWVFMLIVGLLGGLSLFLYGMSTLSKGLQKSAGEKMRAILGRLTKNRLIGVALGTFVTMIIQSSSATTAMLVGFVESRLLRFSQTIGVILGASIGTTITAQLIAFKLTDYSLLMIFVGFVFIFFKNSDNLRNIGQTVLGFGILFFGMGIMSDAMYPLRSYSPFIDLLLQLENPILGILAGLIFTAIIQSSSAFIGIMIILGSQGFLSLEASIPLILGSNIGTSITAILASLNTGREAKKVAIAHTLIKVIGVLIFIWWIPQFTEIVEYISPHSDAQDPFIKLGDEVPRQIANTHTIFNIVITLIFLPITKITAKLIHKMLPPKSKDKNIFKLEHINDQVLQTPVFALNLAKKETIRMARIVQDMLNDIILPFLTKEKILIKEIAAKEQQVDFLRDKIKKYLIKINQKNIPKERVNESFQILYTIKELEQIADIISLNLLRKAEQWTNYTGEFSDIGKNEIISYHLKTQKQLSRAIEVFRDINLEQANRMKQKDKKYRDIAHDLEKTHYQRLIEDIKPTVSSSKTHLELIVLLNEINNHATNIARIMIDWSKEKL